MWDSYYCEWCKTENWINHGDMEDITAVDVEAYRCRNADCKHVTLLGEISDFEAMYGEPGEGETWADVVNVEDGEAPPGTSKSPTVAQLFNMRGTQTGRISCADPNGNRSNMPRSKQVNLTLRLNQKVFLPNPEVSPTDYDEAQRKIVESLEKQGWSVEVTGEEV